MIHPVYYRHIVKDAPEKFARLAKDVFGQIPQKPVAALESFIKECGLPTKLSRLKSTVEITPEVLRQVADTCNIIKAGPRELSRDEIYEILMECL
ncbi:MAG: iron-containing alcohol dehydrogenase [Ruthenibacterium lactatiformans]